MARDSQIKVELKGMKEISEMFNKVPKQVAQYKIWTKFWREVSKPLVKEAQNNAPIAKKDIKYPADKSKTIARGTLKDSIRFFQTKASKEHLGGYIGPRVKGKYAKNKGGYYGAWIEYGSEVMHFGKFKGKDQPFMEDAWNAKHTVVLQDGVNDAEKIFDRVMKSHEKRLQKYGKLGY